MPRRAPVPRDPSPPFAGETIWVRDPHSPLQVPYSSHKVAGYVTRGPDSGKMICERSDGSGARRLVDPGSYPEEWCRAADFRAPTNSVLDRGINPPADL